MSDDLKLAFDAVTKFCMLGAVVGGKRVTDKSVWVKIGVVMLIPTLTAIINVIVFMAVFNNELHHIRAAQEQTKIDLKAWKAEQRAVLDNIGGRLIVLEVLSRQRSVTDIPPPSMQQRDERGRYHYHFPGEAGP